MVFRRAYHPRLTFTTYCLITLFVAVGAFNGQNNLLLWLFGLALGVVLVSGVISGFMLWGMRVQRGPIDAAHAGQGLVTRYTVTNTSRFMPIFAVTIREIPDTSRAGGRSERAGETADAPEAFVLHVPPRSSVQVEGRTVATGRGRLRYAGFRATSAFPFGIIRKSITFDEGTQAIVRAAAGRVGMGVEDLVRTGASLEDSASSTPGLGQEFLSLRAFSPGDNPRLVAWKASARSTDLLVRQNSATGARKVMVVLDATLADAEAAREEAVSLATGVVMAAQRAGYQVGLEVPSHRVVVGARPGARGVGGGHIGRLLNELALLEWGESRGSEARGSEARGGEAGGGSRGVTRVVISARAGKGGEQDKGARGTLQRGAVRLFASGAGRAADAANAGSANGAGGGQ